MREEGYSQLTPSKTLHPKMKKRPPRNEKKKNMQGPRGSYILSPLPFLLYSATSLSTPSEPADNPIAYVHRPVLLVREEPRYRVSCDNLTFNGNKEKTQNGITPHRDSRPTRTSNEYPGIPCAIVRCRSTHPTLPYLASAGYLTSSTQL